MQRLLGRILRGDGKAAISVRDQQRTRRKLRFGAWTAGVVDALPMRKRSTLTILQSSTIINTWNRSHLSEAVSATSALPDAKANFDRNKQSFGIDSPCQQTPGCSFDPSIVALISSHPSLHHVAVQEEAVQGQGSDRSDRARVTFDGKSANEVS
jgi:hypothetical protein